MGRVPRLLDGRDEDSQARNHHRLVGNCRAQQQAHQIDACDCRGPCGVYDTRQQGDVEVYSHRARRHHVFHHQHRHHDHEREGDQLHCEDRDVRGHGQGTHLQVDPRQHERAATLPHLACLVRLVRQHRTHQRDAQDGLDHDQQAVGRDRRVEEGLCEARPGDEQREQEADAAVVGDGRGWQRLFLARALDEESEGDRREDGQ